MIIGYISLLKKAYFFPAQKRRKKVSIAEEKINVSFHIF